MDSQPAPDLVRQLATEGVTEVQVLHLREREETATSSTAPGVSS